MKNSDIVYKIAPRALWKAAEEAGVFAGASIDLQDGFIHFSAQHQVAETLAKHFAAQDDLLLISVDANQLGIQLKWEPSRGGDLFPHLYGSLPLSSVMSVEEVPLDENGKHCLSSEFISK